MSERNEDRALGYEWRIARDPEDGLTYITHPKWSLVGQGQDVEEAAADLEQEAVDVFAVFAGRDDLSDEAARMVDWMRETFGLRATPSNAAVDAPAAAHTGGDEP